MRLYSSEYNNVSLFVIALHIRCKCFPKLVFVVPKACFLVINHPTSSQGSYDEG